METLLKYFSELSHFQKRQFELLMPLYSEWNKKINVISRRDVEELYLRHVIHSLSIAKFTSFNDGSEIMDVGTGGGFPGIPLAIIFPRVNFLLVDSIEKKTRIVQNVAKELGLENVSVYNGRAEDVKRKFDFVICRAVAKTSKLLQWTINNYSSMQNNAIPNGLLALKGGDLKEELSNLQYDFQTYDLSMYFEEEFFETKKLVYVQL